MIKKNLKQYLVLSIALLVIVFFPKKTQEILRHQFLRPFLPLANLISSPHKSYDSSQQYHPITQPIETSYPHSTLAQIIYRSPTQWSSFFWVNVGSDNNYLREVIKYNSPVLYQNHLIGVVDFVGKKQSRVKLITNSSLTLSVRAIRGKAQYSHLLDHVQSLLNYQYVHNDPILKDHLEHLKTQILSSPDGQYLAKGEVYGLSQPLWRSNGRILIGRGFNCNIADDLSLARDLATGKLIDGKGEPTAIIAVDDMLVTTGFDGIFPPHLVVGKVIEVEPVKEGAYYASIKAAPLIANLDTIGHVEIILPLDFNEESPLPF